MNNLNIYQKLQLIQSQINHLTKTEENKFQHYKYVSEYQILTILKPLLAENKLILLFSDAKEGFVKEKQEKEWTVQYQKQVILINSENKPEHLTFYFWACGSNTDLAKAKGSAETYAIKYFLQKLFLIPTSDNLDPDQIGGKKELTEAEKKQVEEILERHKLKPINSPYGK